MVAIVSGNSLGLGLTSLATLGQHGQIGTAQHGRNGQGVYVNVANGNLVVQNVDDYLAGTGADIATIRTYNSLGLTGDTDTNPDGAWSMGLARPPLLLSKTVNTVGSSLTRTAGDGAVEKYGFDEAAGVYVLRAGEGAYDEIAFANGKYTWTDGSTGATEVYAGGAASRLLKSLDASGQGFSYQYNADGLLSGATSQDGEQTVYHYRDQLLSEVRTLDDKGKLTGTRVRYTYDSQDRLVRVVVDLSPQDSEVTDRKVYTTDYTYDGNSKRVASIAQDDQSKLTFTYISVGAVYRLASVTDALNQVTSFKYSLADGETLALTSVTDALGQVTKYEVGTAGKLMRILAAGNGTGVTFQYSEGKVVSLTDGSGAKTTFTYDDHGNCIGEQDASGATIERTFDARNQLLTEKVVGNNGEIRNVYWEANPELLRFTISAEGRVTRYSYDDFGRLTKTRVYGDELYKATKYDQALLLAWADSQGNDSVRVTDMTYDARGQLASRTVDGAVEKFVYDQAGRLLQRVAAGGGTTHYTYDGLGRVLVVTDAASKKTVTVYDDANRRTEVRLASGLVTLQQYDKAGRLVEIASEKDDDRLATTRYTYDGAGRLRMTRDPTGVHSWMLYDAVGRKVADIDGNGTITEYSYNKAGLLEWQGTYVDAAATSLLIDAEKKALLDVSLADLRKAGDVSVGRWLTYDKAGRLVLEAVSQGVEGKVAVTSMAYDSASRLVRTTAFARQVDAPAKPSAAITTPAASGADRITRFFHDADGRTTGVLDAEGYLTETVYDAAGLPVEQVAYARAVAIGLRADATLKQMRPAAHADDTRTVTFHDAKGRAIATVDAEGYLTRTVYDADGNVTQTVRHAAKVAGSVSAKTPLDDVLPKKGSSKDRVTDRTYDKLGRLLSETDPDGVKTTFKYDSAGRLVSTSRASGTAERRTSLARYDALGRLTGELSGEGVAQLSGVEEADEIDAIWASEGIRHSYDKAGRRISTTDEVRRTTHFFYNEDGALTHSVNALGEVRERRYDDQGRLVREIAYDGRISTADLAGGLDSDTLRERVDKMAKEDGYSSTRYTYTADGQVAARTDAEGAVTSYEYNAFGDRVRVEAAGAGAQAYTVDRRGLQTGTIRAIAGPNLVTSTEYDAFGRAVRTVDANGNARSYSFDRLGRQVQARDAMDSTRSTSYDAFDRVLSQTDALGKVTRYAYDSEERSIAITTPEGVVITQSFNEHGQVRQATDGNGNATTYAYDRNGKLLQTKTALATTTNAYDDAGRLVRTTDANGVETEYAYDGAHRIVKRTVDPDELKLVTTYSYDGQGRQVEVTDPQGVVTVTSFDRVGQVLTQTVDPAGLRLKTSYRYDEAGRVLTVRSSGGTITQYEYDWQGRRTEERVDPDGLNLRRRWAYDGNGNVVASADANGNLTRYVYDAADRLVFTVGAAGNTQVNVYDAEGRITRTRSYANPIDLDKLDTAASVDDIKSRLVRDADEDLVQDRVFDDDGRVLATVDAMGAVVRYRYDGNGNVVERRAYARAVPTGTDRSLAAIDAAVAKIDDVGRDQRERYTYDALNRRIYSVDGTGAVVKTTYDKAGNITQKLAYATRIPVGTAGTASALAAAVALVDNSARDVLTRFSYDAANRLVWSVDGQGAVTRWYYDAAGNVVRQRSYATPIAAAAAASTVDTSSRDRNTYMAYDAANRLVFKVDGLRAVTETVYDDNGNVVRSVAYAKAIAAIPTLGTEETAAAIEALLAEDAAADRVTRHAYDSAGRMVYQVDPLGAVTKMKYDDAGRLVEKTRYAMAIPASTGGRAADIAAEVKASSADATEKYAYNAAGQLTKLTDALGKFESSTFDALGRKLTFTNKNGFVWTYVHDAAGRLTTETSPSLTLYRTSITADRLIKGHTDEDSTVVSRYVYDALGNLTRRTEAYGRPEQRTTSFEYDAVGRQVKVTYPPVGVYDRSEDDDLLALPGAFDAARTEDTLELTTRTFYDALGNAVANYDVGAALTQKIYDSAGRVVYEIDALGYVTGYVRNAFGDVTSLTRYGKATNFAGVSVANAADATSMAELEALLGDEDFSHAADRVLLSVYDQAGRLTQVTEPQAFVYNSGAKTGPTEAVGKTTRYTYDAMGQLIRVQALRDSEEGTWATTTDYFDAAGRNVATIDALGYLTFRAYDTAGNLLQVREYATARAAGSWSLTSYGALPAIAGKDRLISYAYDELGRKTSESIRNEYSTDDDATSTVGNLKTTFGYDAVGNQTSIVDANGGIIRNFYDALGRVIATKSPARDGADGATVVPLTVFRRDAHGNLVYKREYAYGAADGSASSFAHADSSSKDRVTWGVFNSHGRIIRSADANGADSYTSYDKWGHIAKQWQGVTGNDGLERTLFQVNTYDKLGRLVQSRTPASTSRVEGTKITVVTQAVAGSVIVATEYNAFGEAIRKGTAGGRQEYFDYDNAGRLWRTNAGDGVDRINLYDVQGNLTAEIRSSGAGLENVDIKTFANAQAAAANPYTRRVDFTYDAMGRLTGTVQAARQELQGKVAVRRQFTSADVERSAAYVGNEGTAWSGTNKVTLAWNSLAYLGSGDVKVTIKYRTEPAIEGGATTEKSYSSSLMTGAAADSGTTLSWSESGNGTLQGGVSGVTRMTVYKKDVNGAWRVVADQAPGYGVNEISVAAPPDPSSTVTLEMRTARSSGTTGWWTAGILDFGDSNRFDARSLSVGEYEYRVTVATPGGDPRVTATGTVTITPPPLSKIAAPLAYGRAGTSTGVLSWTSPGEEYRQVLRYRASGSDHAWNTLTVSSLTPTLDGVKTDGLDEGTYQFELLWTDIDDNIPGSHATGTFKIVAGAPARDVPPENLPPIAGLKIGAVVDSARTIQWTGANANVAQYRLGSGSWKTLSIDNSSQTRDESGRPSGLQRVSLANIAPGTYQLRLFVGGAADPTKQATATFTVYPQDEGHEETYYAKVPKATKVVASYNGTTPVYAKDESGAFVYETTYVQEARTRWIEGDTPAPKLTVTTPPYTAGYTIAAVPRKYTVSVSASPGTVSISGTEGASISQDAGRNGGTIWQRPVVLQKTDRWGNVVEISDPRAADWVTSYEYNARNQLVEQLQPNSHGTISSSSPRTSIYYDKLGRQIAIRDANENINAQAWDAGGNLVRETHADGGKISHRYNVFGEKVTTIDAMGNEIGYTYDKLGRLLSTRQGSVNVYRATSSNNLQLVRTGAITQSWTYDALGQRLTHENGNGETLSYAYDLRGNLVATTQPLGQVSRAAFDAQGRKIAEQDAAGKISTWTYDYFGQLTKHVDLGGEEYSYTYDRARQLLTQTSTRGASQAWTYDAAGQIKQIRDLALNKTTTYAYDLSGRKVREQVVQAGVTYQDNHLAYDEKGWLRDIADGRVHIKMYYDRVGNRTAISTRVNYLGVSGEVTSDTDRYFKYDAMNRQTVVDAVDADYALGKVGHAITYDKNGNRTSDTYYGNRVREAGGKQVINGYDEAGVAIYATTPLKFVADEGITKEVYKYDALNRLKSVERDGTQVDVRMYDGADRVIQSGSATLLTRDYAALINKGLAAAEMNGTERRISRYDANGRLLHQKIRVTDEDNEAWRTRAEMSWDSSEGILTQGGSGLVYTANGYDAAGNVRGYVLQDNDSNITTEYRNAAVMYEGYQVGVSTATKQGRTDKDVYTVTQKYDVNGHLVGVDDWRSEHDRTFVNDAAGRQLFVKQDGRVQRQLIVNGEVLGLYGAAPAGNPNVVGESAGGFANLVDFDFGYSKVSASYPSASPGSYQVRSGDDLRSIARSAYGDSAQWYRIAEANGLSGDADMRVGQTLNIPNRVSFVNNNSTTFKPYNPAEIQGDMTPNLPPPQDGGGGCGGMGQVLMVVVAIVVTIYTAGAAAGLLGATSTVATGSVAAASAASGFAGTLTVGAGVLSGAYGAAGLAAAAIGAAAGSVASQLVGVATGTIDKFDWKGVALSAVSAGMTAGVGSIAALGTGIGGTMARAAISNAATQGIAVATGLQRSFDWRGVAASAVGAGVGAAVGEGLGINTDAFRNNASFGEQLGKRMVAGLAAGTVAAVMRGGKVVVQQVAADAFGNALGQSIADAASSPSVSGGEPWAADVAARRQSLDPLGLRGYANDIAGVMRSAQAIWGPMPSGSELSDSSTDAEVAAQQLREAGYEGGLVPSGGVRVTGMSVNRRAETAFQGADDLAGMASLYRDYKLLGSVISEQQQQTTMDRLKGILQEKLGPMRVMPSPESLGAIPGIGSDGAARYDKADLIDRYSDALRKLEMWKQGIVGLDTRSMLITWVGNQRMSPAQYLTENETRYQRAFTRGVELGEERYARSELRYPADMPKQLQVGLFADDFGKRTLLTYNSALGVPEGPGQIISLNRWSYDPQGTGLYIRNDVLVDLGPNQRYWIDGKSSLAEAQNSAKQFETFNRYTGAVRGKVATPQGLFEILPNGRIRR